MREPAPGSQASPSPARRNPRLEASARPRTRAPARARRWRGAAGGRRRRRSRTRPSAPTSTRGRRATATAPPAVERAGDRLRERLGRFGALSLDDRDRHAARGRPARRLPHRAERPRRRRRRARLRARQRDRVRARRRRPRRACDSSTATLVDGVEHLAWEQRYRGVPAVDAGLEAAVTGSGRLVALTGPPAADLAVRSVEPAIGARAAYAAARDERGCGRRRAGDRVGAARGAEQRDALRRRRPRVAGALPGRRAATGSPGACSRRSARPASTTCSSTRAPARSCGARTASTSPTRRSSSTRPRTGRRSTRLHRRPWLLVADAAAQLSGPNAHAFADVHDVVRFDADDGRVEPHAGARQRRRARRRTTSTTADVAPGCRPADDAPAASPCTWDPRRLPDSLGRRTASRASTQLFYLVNKFHDHLRERPGHRVHRRATSSAPGQPLGDPNFDANAANSDPVLAQALDGARQRQPACPTATTTTTRTSSRCPDGLPGLMQMYLWRRRRSAPTTARTTRRWSSTSTRTACRTGS